MFWVLFWNYNSQIPEDFSEVALFSSYLGPIIIILELGVESSDWKNAFAISLSIFKILRNGSIHWYSIYQIFYDKSCLYRISRMGAGSLQQWVDTFLHWRNLRCSGFWNLKIFNKILKINEILIRVWKFLSEKSMET